MAINSESPATQVSQEGPGVAAGRLAYSVDEVAHLTGLSRDLLRPGDQSAADAGAVSPHWLLLLGYEP
jgi:hypothetical protein